jgi:hypothetical protein
MRNKIINMLLVSFAVIFMSLGGVQFASGWDLERNVPHSTVDPKFQPRPGTYYYLFDLNSMSIGTGRVTIDREGDLYKMLVTAQTNSTIDHLYRMRYRGENIINTDHISPVETSIQQQVRSVKKDTTIHFQNDGTIKTTEKKSDKGKTSQDEREIRTERFTLDPFSVTYLVRVLDWSVGVEQIFDLYTGKGQYELRLKCSGTKVIEAGQEKRNAWVIIPSVKKMDGEEDSKKMPIEMKIYVSADELKDVLEIDASYKIGRLRALMERFEPADNSNKLASEPNKQIEMSRDYKGR